MARLKFIPKKDADKVLKSTTLSRINKWKRYFIVSMFINLALFTALLKITNLL